MLSCTNLALSRSGACLVHGVGFTLLPGALMHIRGTNGVGKTTLLHALAGLIRPEEGGIAFAGTDIWGDMDYRAEVALLTHRPDISGSETVREALHGWARLYGTPERLKTAAGYWKLDPLAEQPLRSLSAGWQQRVALARLMLKPAVIWLLDEPVAHLDAEGRRLFWELLITRANRNGIVVLTAHETEIPIPTAQWLDLNDYASPQTKSEQGFAA